MELKLATENLKVGMYVCRLDRPWLDTPFLIQGFYIRTPCIDGLRICPGVPYGSPYGSRRHRHVGQRVGLG